MKRNLYIGSLIIMFIMIFANLSQATDRYVSTSGNDLTGDGSIGNPWQTIQHAIDNSVTSDVIIVSAGTYTENLIIGTSGLTLTNNGGALPVIDGGGSGSVVLITANDVVFNGFQVQHSGLTGIEAGIGIQGANNCDIKNSTITNTFSGIALIGSGTNFIRGNTLTLNYFGIYIGNSTNPSNTNTITDNEVATSIYLALGGGSFTGDGIYVDQDCIGNIFTKNNIHNNGKNGIYFWKSSASTIEENIIDGNLAAGLEFMGSANNTVNENVISNNQTGIWVRSSATHPSSPNAIHNNSITGNTTLGVSAEIDVTSVDATCNWWGSNSAADIIADISGNITYLHYLGDGTDASSDMGFQPSSTCPGSCVVPPLYHGAITPTTMWQTDSKTLESTICYVYKISMTQGNEYTVKTGCGDGATAAFDTRLERYNAAGVLVSTNDDGCESYRSDLTWTATESVGYVAVKGYNATNFGAYTIAYKYTSSAGGSSACKTPPEFDATLTAANTTEKSQSGTIAAGECDVYKLPVTDDQVIYIQTGCSGTATSNFDTYLELYNTTGTLIASNDDGCELGRSKIIYTATYTGDIYIKVRGYNATSAGTYTMTYTTSAGGSSTCKTPPDFDLLLDPVDGTVRSQPGTIAAGACKVYQLPVTDDQVVYIQTGCSSTATADFDTYLELYNSTGTLITSNDDGCEEGRSKIIYTATYTGMVYIKVRGYNATSAGDFVMTYTTSAGGSSTCKTPPDFDLLLDPVDGTVRSQPGTIAAGACKVYQLPVTDDQVIYIQTGCSSTATADFDTYLELYNSTGTLITSNDDGCEEGRSKIIYTATYTGMVYIKVSGYNATNAGDFVMTYTTSAGGSSTCKTPPDFDLLLDPVDGTVRSQSGTIAAGACKVYQLPVTDDQVIYIQTGCSSTATADFDTYLELYNTTGTLITSNDDGCEEGRSKIIYTATYTGMVYIKVRGYNATSAGDFVMTYTTSAGGSSTCKTPPDFDLLLDPVDGTVRSQSASIAAGACKVYQLPVTDDQVIYIQTGCSSAATADFDTYLELYNSTGTLITSNDDGCEEGRSKIIYTATYTGMVYIKVRGYNATSAGDFVMTYTTSAGGSSNCKTPPDFDVTLAQPSIVWLTAAGTIAAGECIVYEVPYIKTGVAFTFKTGCGDGATASFDTYFELYNATGTLITTNDDGCEQGRSTITWTATYGTGIITDVAYLRVKGYNATAAGTFTLAYNYVGSKGAVGAEEFANSSFIKIYPNPATLKFTIASKEPVTFNGFTLTELTGKVVRNVRLNQPVTTYEVETTELAPGVYLLSVETSEGWIRSKVSITR